MNLLFDEDLSPASAMQARSAGYLFSNSKRDIEIQYDNAHRLVVSEVTWR